MTQARALVVEDDADARAALADTLEGLGYAATRADGVAAAGSALAESGFDLALIDVHLPDGEGHEIVPAINAQGPCEIVFITGDASVDSAVRALRAGATDYLTKPIDPNRLETIASTVLRTLELRGEVSTLRRKLRQAGRFCDMIGSSDSMQAVYDLIEQVAPTDSTVMVLGETGTGKELVAAAVHALSRRAKQPFVPLNCGAVAATLIESELFGHEKGSFTGAERMHRGVFERAHGGTLFLDELPEMPVELQVKLLRVIEAGQVTRVGGDRPIDVDVRLVAATNRDPHEAVKDGDLREDLLYRLLVFPIQLPPLRDRGEDVEILAQHFVDEQNQANDGSMRISDAATALLRRAAWPGNVRELKHTIERAYILSSDRITPETLPIASGAEAAALSNAADARGANAGNEGRDDDGDGTIGATSTVGVAVGMSLAEAEKRLILATLESVDSNKKAAAKMLGVSVKTLYNRLREYRGT